MIGSEGRQTAALAERRARVPPRFPGFEEMAFFPGAYWEYSWREMGITNGKIDPDGSGIVRVELSNPIDVDLGPARALRLFEMTCPTNPARAPAWWPQWHYLGIDDGVLYAAAEIDAGEYGVVTIFDSKTGEVHPQGFMGSFSGRRPRSVTSRPTINPFLITRAVVVEERFFDPDADMIGGVRICDGERHHYKIRELYLPGKGFGGWSRSGTSIYAGGGYVDIFEAAIEVRLTATNL